MESAASVTVESAAKPAAIHTATVSRVYATAIATAEPATVASTIAAVTATVSITAAISAIAVSATEPRAGSDKDAAGEPRWAIVAIRCAGIRIVVVIAVIADRRGIFVAAAVVGQTANADPN
jgi:hypothetical protein